MKLQRVEASLTIIVLLRVKDGAALAPLGPATGAGAIGRSQGG